MKLDRLLEITVILLNRDSVTSGELAERFGVSQRTIYRDIEALSMAGIPVYVTRGRGGGISLLKHFTLSRSIMTPEEQENILFALQTFQATGYPDGSNALEKISALFRQDPVQWVRIDFSSWEAGPGSNEMLRLVRKAILQSQVLRIEYAGRGKCRTVRDIEPCQLLYKAHCWYLSAWCRARQGFRLFRFSRIRRMSLTGESFQPGRVPPEDMGQDLRPEIHLVLRCSPAAAGRLYDDYDERLLTEHADGSVTLEVDYPEDEWVYGYILGFGADAQVLEPPHLRRIIRERIRAMQKIYGEPDDNSTKDDTQMSDLEAYNRSHEAGSSMNTKRSDFEMMNPEMKFCQSCGMPLSSDEVCGTEQDGTKSEDYCIYCYKDGAFTAECSMEEMIEFCMEPCLREKVYPDAETARLEMNRFFPTLKRWKKA